jgi:hypothetical protein
MRRHVHPGDKSIREDTASGRRQRHRLGLDDRRDTLADQRQRGIDAEQFAAKRKAIIG